MNMNIAVRCKHVVRKDNTIFVLLCTHLTIHSCLSRTGKNVFFSWLVSVELVLCKQDNVNWLRAHSSSLMAIILQPAVPVTRGLLVVAAGGFLNASLSSF